MNGKNYDDISDLYDLFTATGYDFDFFRGEIRRAGMTVLELTSGTGRLSIPLIEAGAELTCIDMSRGMLDILSTKLRERNLTARVLQADICELSFHSEFELAIIPFQTFMELIGPEKQARALQAVHRALCTSGRFICTMHNPELRRHSVDGILRIVGRYPQNAGSLVISGFEQGGDPVVTRHQFFEYYDESGKLAWKRMQTLDFELIERADFQKMAGQAGFEIRRLYGDYDRSEFDAQRSPAMIWVLEKERSWVGTGST